MPITTPSTRADQGGWSREPPRTMAELRARYRHTVWSNPDGASDDVYLFKALVGGSFHPILDFACVVGLERLQAAWRTLEADEPDAPDIRRAAPHVRRILQHIQVGWKHPERPPLPPHPAADAYRPEHFAPELALLEEEPGGWSVVGGMAVIVWAERYLGEAECRTIVGADLPLLCRHLSLRGHRVHALAIRGLWGETSEWQEGRCEDTGRQCWSLATHPRGDPRRRLIQVSDQTLGLAPGEGLALRVNHRETRMHVLDPVSCLLAESERLRHRLAAGVTDGRQDACRLGLLLATLPRYLAEIAARVSATVNTREEEARARIAQVAAQELLCGGNVRNQAPGQPGQSVDP